MVIEFSTEKRPRSFKELMLFCVYHVEADESYNTIKGVSRERRGTVAIRTLSGKGKLSIGDNTSFTLTDDTLLIVPAWKLDRYSPSDNAWNFWWFEYENGVDFLPEEQIFSVQSTTLEDELFHRALYELRKDTQEGAETGSAMFSALMGLWRDSISGQLNAEREDPILNLAAEIRRMPEREYFINELAESCFISVRRFRELFSQKIGMSPKNYIIHSRMEHARTMLLKTELPVSQISEACGYSDALYFSREFSRIYGLPPSSFRQLGLEAEDEHDNNEN